MFISRQSFENYNHSSLSKLINYDNNAMCVLYWVRVICLMSCQVKNKSMEITTRSALIVGKNPSKEKTPYTYIML